MPNKQLLDYVYSQLAQGVSQEIIKTNLITGGGWVEADVMAAFEFVKLNPQTQPNPPLQPPITANPATFTATNTPVNNPQGFSSPIEQPQIINNKKHLSVYVICFAVLAILISATAFAYFEKIGPFGIKQYTEANFLSSILEKTTQIQSSSYKATASLAITPREEGAEPFEIKISNNEALKKLYANDYKRAQDVNSILSQLKYQEPLPSSLEKFFQDLKSKNTYFYGTVPSLKDPATGNPYQYTLTDGGKNFSLKVSFETKEAISNIKKSYGYTNEGTPISGQEVTFTKESESYLYLQPEPPKPFLLQMEEYTTYLPAELSADMSLSAAADLEKSNWKFNIDANGNFGDLTYKVNIDALKKDSDYFIKINNIPSLFLGALSSVKGEWVKLTTASESSNRYDELSLIAKSLPEMEQTYKENKEEFSKIIKKVVQFADEEKLIEFGKKPSSEKIADRTLYRYDIKIRKEAVVPFYKKLLAEASNGEYKNYQFIINDPGLLEYFESNEFEEIFDYYNKNTFLTVWTDKAGFPAQIEYRMRVVPSEKVTQLSDKQANIVFTFSILDINQEVIIDTPSNAKNLKDIIKNSPLGEAMNTGANASIKANLANIRANGELYYDSNNSYGKASAKGKCDTANTLFTDKNIKSAIDSVKKTHESNEIKDTISCWSSSTAWALSAKLITDDPEQSHWCVDSTGVSKVTNAHASSTNCPN